MFFGDANVTSTYDINMIKVGDPTATRYADIIGYSNTGTEKSSSAQSAADNSGSNDKRVINDTIELSDGAKQVNLSRGLDLAEAVRNEKDPEKVYELIKSGTEDINRIGTLFGEVARDIRALFGLGRV